MGVPGNGGAGMGWVCPGREGAWGGCARDWGGGHGAGVSGTGRGGSTGRVCPGPGRAALLPTDTVSSTLLLLGVFNGFNNPPGLRALMGLRALPCQDR